MRTYSDIVKSVGFEVIHKDLGVSVHTARSWAQRNRIPAEHWKAFADRDWATLDELAELVPERPSKQGEAA